MGATSLQAPGPLCPAVSPQVADFDDLGCRELAQRAAESHPATGSAW